MMILRIPQQFDYDEIKNKLTCSYCGNHIMLTPDDVHGSEEWQVRDFLRTHMDTCEFDLSDYLK